MKNILLATDFSYDAYNALFFATELFKDRACNIYLLNAYTEMTQILTQKVGVEGKRSLLDQLKDESIEGLNEVYHKIHLDQGNPLHHFKAIPKNDHLVDAIKHALEMYNIDLLVMGNKGKTSARNIFWGSNVVKVLKEIDNCPVLIVPKEIESELPKEIAFATDYQRPYNAKLLYPLLYTANLCKSSICVLHINEEERLNAVQKSNLFTLREYLGEIKHSIHWMPDFSSKSRVIQTFLDELSIGMLAMIRYHHGFISRLIREAVIEKISFDLKIPFLVIPCGDDI